MRSVLYLMLAGLAGCALTAGGGGDRRIDVDSHTLLGELALERQQFEEATGHFLQVALLSHDPAASERATRMAHELGMTDAGLRAVRRWRQLDPADERVYWFSAVLETRNGREERALADFRALLERVGNPGVGLALVTEALVNEPDTSRATRIMLALTGDYPDTVEGHYGLARLAMRSGEFELALDNARAAATLDPDWLEGQLLLARALLVSGRTDESLALAAMLAEEHPELEIRLQYAELLLSAGRSQEAELLLDAILVDHPGLPEAVRALAFLALTQEELETAEQRFNELRGDARYRDEAFYYLGRIAETDERFLQATRSYARVTDGTHAVEAQLRTARVLLAEMSDPEGALRHLEEFGNANPRYATQMLMARGQLLVQMQRPQEAMRLLADAVAASPDDATLQEAHAQLYVILAQEASDGRDLPGAEAMLDEGLALYPENASLRYSMALLNERRDRPRRAVALLRELVRENPEDPTFLNALGYILADRMDRHEEAREYIQKALAMEPDNPAIIDSMGWLLFKLGDYEAALGYLERAYRLERDPEIAAHLVDVYWALGERQQALELLRGELEQHPDSRHLRDVSRRIEQ